MNFLKWPHILGAGIAGPMALLLVFQGTAMLLAAIAGGPPEVRLRQRCILASTGDFTPL